MGDLDTAVTAVTVAPGDSSGAVMSKSFFNRKKSESSGAARRSMANRLVRFPGDLGSSREESLGGAPSLLCGLESSSY